jgi:hypothetical protein
MAICECGSDDDIITFTIMTCIIDTYTHKQIRKIHKERDI